MVIKIKMQNYILHTIYKTFIINDAKFIYATKGEIYMKKMKTMKTRFLALGVCLAVFFCSLTPVQVADAAAKKINVTVRYKGKNVTFETFPNTNKYSNDTKITLKAKTYAAVKKAWGKADKVEKRTYENEYGKQVRQNIYTWKSGKTEISMTTDKKGKRNGDIFIDIQNKKASFLGIKVGMSKKPALQKLRKLFGKKMVSTEKDKIRVTMGGYPPMIIELKSGKVKSIFFWHS